MSVFLEQPMMNLSNSNFISNSDAMTQKKCSVLIISHQIRNQRSQEPPIANFQQNAITFGKFWPQNLGTHFEFFKSNSRFNFCCWMRNKCYTAKKKWKIVQQVTFIREKISLRFARFMEQEKLYFNHDDDDCMAKN